MSFLLPVAVFSPMVCGCISYLIGRFSRKARDAFVLLTALATAALCLVLFLGEAARFDLPGFCGMGLSLRTGPLHGLLALLAASGWLGATLFSREYFVHGKRRNRYYLFWLMTLGATLGIFLSGDLFTTFVFFEVMSFTSYVLVVQTEEKAALRAGETYLAVAVIGGLATLTGLFFLQHLLGTLSLEEMGQAARAAENRGILWAGGILTLSGFAAKAGAFPLHVWLPTAHPAAPAPASAVLSGVITKTGLYGVLVLTATVFLHDEAWGFLLAALGGITMALGAVLALCSVDLKRMLACSSVSQIGFLLLGAGAQALLGHHNALAVDGTILYLVNHSLVKMALFPAAGVIYLRLHSFDLNVLRGYGRGKPLLMAAMLPPMLSLAGVPGFTGYVGKTLLHESLVELIHLGTGPIALFTTLEWLFLLTGGLTAAYLLKLFFCLFVEPPLRSRRTVSKKIAAPLSLAVLLCYSALALLPGLWPDGLLMPLAAGARAFLHGEAPAHAVAWFAWVNLKGALISLTVGTAVYLLVVRKWLIRQEANVGKGPYWNPIPARMDLEIRVYRPVLKAFARGCGLLALLLDRLFYRLVFQGVPAAAYWVTGAAQAAVDRLSYRFTGRGYRRRPDPEQPGLDHHFGYYQDRPAPLKGFVNSFAFGLMLAGCGLALAFLFVLLRRLL